MRILKLIIWLTIGFLILSLILNCNSKLTLNPKSKSINSQNYIPYHIQIYEVDSLYIIEEYHRSFTILDSLFHVFEPKNIHYEYSKYINSAYKINQDIDYKNAFKFLTEVYGFTPERAYFDTLLIEVYNNKIDKSWKVEEWQAKFEKNRNYKLEKMIHEMRDLDQKFRVGDYAEFSWETKKLRDSADSINESKLTYILENFGFPYYGFYIGNTGNDRLDIGTILLHTDDSIRIKYFAPKILELVKRGICTPIEYGQLIDQYYLYNEDVQIYNTYLNDKCKYDTITTSELRLNIGLPKSLSVLIWTNYQLFKKEGLFKTSPHLEKIFLKNIYSK